MSRKFHKIRRLYGPSLLVKPARYVSGDMDLIAGPSAEQAEKEFADENWRDDSGAPQARQPKRRHIGAVSAIVGAAFDAATTPAARKRLSKQELALTVRAPSANWATPVNYLWTTFADRCKRFTRDGSEKVHGTGSAEVAAYMPTQSGVGMVESPVHGDTANNPYGLRPSGKSYGRLNLTEPHAIFASEHIRGELPSTKLSA